MGKSDAEIDSFINQKLQGQTQTLFSPRPQTASVSVQNEQPKEENKSVGGFAKNIIKSAGGFIADTAKGVYNSLRHPVETVDNIATPIAGAVESGIEHITGKPFSDQSDINKGKAVAEFYKNRYGSVENILNTLYNDPVGFAADASAVASLVGGTFEKAGELSKISQLTKAGEVTSKTGEILDPIQSSMKVAGKVLPDRAVESVSKRLYQSALKPSGTPEEASRIVQTGLRERIPVSEHGYNQVQNIIHDINKEVENQIKAGTQSEKLGMALTAPPKLKSAAITGERSTLGEGILIDGHSVAERLSEVRDFYRDTVAPHTYLEDLDKLESSFLNAHGKAIPIEQAQKLKQNTYQVLRKAYGEMKSAQIEGQKALARGLKEEIVKQYPEINNLNGRETALIELEDQLERFVKRNGNTQIVGIGTPITAMAGAALSPSKKLGLIAGFAKAALDNPEIKSKLAILLSKASSKTGRAAPLIKKVITPATRVVQGTRK